MKDSITVECCQCVITTKARARSTLSVEDTALRVRRGVFNEIMRNGGRGVIREMHLDVYLTRYYMTVH